MSSAGAALSPVNTVSPGVAAYPPGRVHRAGRRRERWLAVYLGAAALGGVAVAGAFAASIDSWTPGAWLTLLFVALCALWISGGAAAALIGFMQRERAASVVPDSWQPPSRTAILVLLCGEAPEPVAAYLRDLRRRCDESGLAQGTTLFVLSDTQDADKVAAEESVLAALISTGSIVYRRRAANEGRKPGNIADWLRTHGVAFEFMLVLDADSRMTARRIRALIYRMTRQPEIGLLQAGIAMVPGRSRFGRHQRLANRLLSPNFGRGLAAWAGDAGNYWGHNAIIRTRAFRSAVALPVLSGPAPFGGSILSHDFVEAAWIRRAGWSVALDPDTRGSAEDGPQTFREYCRRDRRWCQGNLQHLRVLGAPGLDPVSRLHLVSGIASYLVAPLWFALVLLFASGQVVVSGLVPLLLIAGILLVPKACALAQWSRRARTRARRRMILRATLNELLLSTLIAPLIMLRQSAAVLGVLSGRDCGWKSRVASRFELPSGLPECAAGAGLLALGTASGSTASALWLLPVSLPLLAAPLLQRWLDRGAR